MKPVLKNPSFEHQVIAVDCIDFIRPPHPKEKLSNRAKKVHLLLWVLITAALGLSQNGWAQTSAASNLNNTTNVSVNSVAGNQASTSVIANQQQKTPQELPIEQGERLSSWLLKEKAAQDNTAPLGQTSSPYYLGTSWLTPEEITQQTIDKQSLINALEKIPFAKDAAGNKAKKSFAQLIDNMRITGRVPLPNTNPRYLEVKPKLDPILENQDRVIIPKTPTTITLIRTNGTLCKIAYRPNVEARFYVEGCKLKGKLAEGNPDWAWIVEPDGTIHKVSVAAWNSATQVFPAPGSWIWAPPHWSKWTKANGEEFTQALITMLATQGPSGLSDAIDDGVHSRASLPRVDPKDLYSVARDLPISANIWGETGLMQTPSARTAPAGTGAITLGLFQPYGNLNLFFAPVNGVEFIMRYTNINDVPYGSQALSGGQSYKDKSVGLKVRLLEENAFLPQVAVGARDMLGTGLLSGEYFVASKRHNNFDFSAGMGWGQLGTRNNVTNPFVTAFGQNYATRPAVTYNQGGTSTGGFFHGTAALFGGVQYQTPWDNVVLKAEVDGNNYQQLPFSNTLPIKSIFNFGATYQMKNADFTIGSLGNSQVMFTVTLHERLDLLNTPKLAEAKPIPVALKDIGNYRPSNPMLTLPLQPATQAKTVAQAQDNLSKQNKVVSQKNAPTTIAASESQNRNLENSTASTSSTIPASLDTIQQTGGASNSSSPPTAQATNAFSKKTITTQYNSTLIDFEQQTQWQVKGLREQNAIWTVHLLDASGVFIRSRLNRGIAVLHRDAPSQIETFNVQFYNWGMLVSEFTVDRKQWMLSQTQLLTPSQRYPSITVADTDSIPNNGGNPFWRASPSVNAKRTDTNNTSNTASGNLVVSNKKSDAYIEDELNHKPLSTNVGISYAQVVGSPDSPFLFSLGVKGDAVYKFRENTWLTGTVNVRAIDNFGKYNYDPPPTGLQPVRTDIRQYMTQSIATMPNLQLTNTGKLGNNHFVSAYAGYLEMMFAGAGGEYLWRPTNSRIAVGADINRVRQRQFNVWTSMQDYAVTTGHLTTYWDTGVQDLLVKLSYGKYLAGDVGGTLDISRVFKNGVKIGAYATRTNVDYAQFGEGSFDKGVYLSIPFDAFFARHSDSSANMLFTPLIRDGGAMLMRKYRLYDMTRTRDERALTTGPD